MSLPNPESTSKSVPYPENATSEYPVYMRKVAKLAHFLADDWINWKDGNDDHEWVPNLIQVDMGKRGEENPYLYTLVMKADDYSVEIWFSNDDEPTLDVDYLFEELVQFREEEDEDLCESNLTGWINAVEEAMLQDSDAEEICSRFYEDGELLADDWNENISQDYEVIE